MLTVPTLASHMLLEALRDDVAVHRILDGLGCSSHDLRRPGARIAWHVHAEIFERVAREVGQVEFARFADRCAPPPALTMPSMAKRYVPDPLAAFAATLRWASLVVVPTVVARSRAIDARTHEHAWELLPGLADAPAFFEFIGPWLESLPPRADLKHLTLRIDASPRGCVFRATTHHRRNIRDRLLLLARSWRTSDALRPRSTEIDGARASTIGSVVGTDGREALLEAWDRCPDFVAFLVDGRIAWSNRAFLNELGGGSSSRLRGRALEDLVPPEERPRVGAYLGRGSSSCGLDASAPSATVVTMLTITRADGARLPVEFSAPTSVEFDGRHALLITGRDASAHLGIVAALRDADRRRNDWLATLSHELRNPLAPLHTGLALLARVPPESESARKALAIVDRQAQLLTRLVDDLLDHTKVGQDKVRLELDTLDLVGLVADSVEDHRAAFAAKGIDLITSVGAPSLPICGDRARLAQSLGNLLQNACRFTPRGGRVEVELVEDRLQRRAVVSVRDDGIGIAADLLPRIFEPFVQGADGTPTSGLGLGLAIVHAFVHHHGGIARASSDGPGRGAEFVIELPLLPALASGQRAPRRDDTPPDSARCETRGGQAAEG